LGPRGGDSCRFPIRGLVQRRLASNWNRSYGTNENIAGAGGKFFREAVSAHRGQRTPPPVSEQATPPFPPLRHAQRAEKNKRPTPVERELEPTVQGLRRASRRCAKSPVPSQQG